MPFKKLTLSNWTEADPISTMFGRVSPLVGPVVMTEQDWARDFLSVELGQHVPEEIRELFDEARGAMLYGWFFYPLFRLGEDQLHRVVEAAARARYRIEGGPRQSPSFSEAIRWLVEREVIPHDQRERWEGARHLRNAASHPSRASGMPPGAVLRMLRASARDIDQLFPGHQDSADARTGKR